MSNYYENLLPENYYHVFSRAVGKEKLFVEEDNYRFFLNKFNKYIAPVANIHAYCLLPNHFHFLIEIKSSEEIKKVFRLIKKDKLYNNEVVADFLMEQFSNLLNSYTKSFNKKYNRKGALFMDFMRRVSVNNDEQFGATLFYIHKNPVHHGMVKQMEHWKWSSYNTFFSKASTKICRDYVLKWFQGNEGFAEYHKQTIYLKNAVIID